MKSDAFEYAYQPRLKQRGRLVKEEDYTYAVQETDMVGSTSSLGLLLLLEACQRLDGFSPDAKDAFCPPMAQTLLRRAGTGRRKRRSIGNTETDCTVSTIPTVPLATESVVHYLEDGTPEALAETMHLATVNVAGVAKRKGRKELHGPCSHCGARCSPQWRKGPKCKPVLCNACGIRFLRTRSLGKVSRGRKRKTRSRDMDDAGDDSDSSDFMDVPDPKRSHRVVKADMLETRPVKMPRTSRNHFVSPSATVAIIAATAPAAVLDDSETTSSTSTAEPRLETTNHLFCTANSVVGVEVPAVRTPFLLENVASQFPALQPGHIHQSRLGQFQNIELAPAGSTSPVLTVAPLVLSMPDDASAVANVSMPMWTRRKPSSGPSKALFKKA